LSYSSVHTFAPRADKKTWLLSHTKQLQHTPDHVLMMTLMLLALKWEVGRLPYCNKAKNCPHLWAAL